MTTQVNLHSSLISNVAQSIGIEPAVSPFSMAALLRTNVNNKEIPASLQQTDAGLDDFKFTDEHDELTAAEFLQYWELPRPPPAAEAFSLEPMPVINADASTLLSSKAPDFVNSGSENSAEPLLQSDFTREPVTAMSEPLPQAGIVLESAVLAQTTPVTLKAVESAHLLQAVVAPKPAMAPLVHALEPEVEAQTAPAGALKTAEYAHLSQTVVALKPELQASNASLLSNKEPQFVNKDKTMRDLFEVQQAVLPAHLKNQEQPVSMADFLQPKNDNEALLKSNEFAIQSNLALPAENQNVINNDVTAQQLTTHLNDFLHKSMGSDPGRFALATSDFQAQFKMELSSLKPEVLAQQANYKIENYTAQISINPPELGQITAKIEVNQGATSIVFMTEHAHVQQLLERHLQELHEVFQTSNLNLGSVDIHYGGAQDNNEASAYQKPTEDDDLKQKSTLSNHLEGSGGQRKKSLIDIYT
ncbi:MAG: flagellar hook-length control protein FliK [Legionellales bacterium]